MSAVWAASVLGVCLLDIFLTALTYDESGFPLCVPAGTNGPFFGGSHDVCRNGGNRSLCDRSWGLEAVRN